MKRFCDLVAGDKVFIIEGIYIKEYTLRTPFTFNYPNSDCCAFPEGKSVPLQINKSAYKKSSAGKYYAIFADESLAVKTLKGRLSLLIERQTQRVAEAKRTYEAEQKALAEYLDRFEYLNLD